MLLLCRASSLCLSSLAKCLLEDIRDWMESFMRFSPRYGYIDRCISLYMVFDQFLLRPPMFRRSGKRLLGSLNQPLLVGTCVAINVGTGLLEMCQQCFADSVQRIRFDAGFVFHFGSFCDSGYLLSRLFSAKKSRAVRSIDPTIRKPHGFH